MLSTTGGPGGEAASAWEGQRIKPSETTGRGGGTKETEAKKTESNKHVDGTEQAAV